MLPQELLLLPAHELIILRSGIPPVKGRRIRYYEDKRLVSRTIHLVPNVEPRPVDRSALAALREDLTEDELVVAELTDDEASTGTAPSDVVLDKNVVQALKSDLDVGIERLTDLFSTSPADFVD